MIFRMRSLHFLNSTNHYSGRYVIQNNRGNKQEGSHHLKKKSKQNQRTRQREPINHLMFRSCKTKEILEYKEVRLQLIHGKLRQVVFLKLTNRVLKAISRLATGHMLVASTIWRLKGNLHQKHLRPTWSIIGQT